MPHLLLRWSQVPAMGKRVYCTPLHEPHVTILPLPDRSWVRWRWRQSICTLKRRQNGPGSLTLNPGRPIVYYTCLSSVIEISELSTSRSHVLISGTNRWWSWPPIVPACPRVLTTVHHSVLMGRATMRSIRPWSLIVMDFWLRNHRRLGADFNLRHTNHARIVRNSDVVGH